jgi:hypothetical protein
MSSRSGKTKPVQFLKRQVPKKQDEFVICAFDMETRGLGGEFIICAFWAEDGTRYVAYTLSDAFTWMVEHPQYRYLAHNASGYEFAYLYPYIHEYFEAEPEVEIKPTIQGDSRIVQFILLRDGKTWMDMRDTLCLFNASLASVANSFAPEIPKGEPPWNKNHDNFDPSQQLWMDYLWRDCEIILIAYRKLATIIWDQFHTNLGVTAGSTAMRAFKTCIGSTKDGKSLSYPRLHPDQEKFMREGYYGAAVFPGHQVGNWGRVAGVDVNGAYAFQMGTHSFPVRAPFKTGEYQPGFLGMYRVLATVPESVYRTIGFNPIPRRTANGLVWSSGTFEAVLSSIELDYAIKVGCTFEVIEGYYWTKGEPVFKDFVEKCQALEVKDNGIYKPAIKLLRNSAYGKFGSKTTHTSVLFSTTIPQGSNYIPMTNEVTGELIPDVYIGEESTDADYIMPHWAAFITAWERVYLFEIMEEAYKRGAHNLYCDTDSIKGDAHIILQMVEDGTIPVGKEYGKFKVEEICDEFILIGPKTYYGRDGDGKEIKKAKGVPKQLLKRGVYIDALENNRKQMIFDSVQSVMRLIKQNGGTLPLKRKRTLTDITNSSAWEINEHGEIYPFGYQQALQLLVA